MNNVLALVTTDPIEEALRHLAQDPGSLFAPVILEQLRVMRNQAPDDFARLRHRVKSSKQVSMFEFDRLTASRSDECQSGGKIFAEVTPWPEPVAVAELLDDITRILIRYVVAEPATLHAAALWVAFSWLVDVVQVAPIANITAPEKRCGKTILLTALGKLVRRPLQVSNISPSALFRCIEQWSPTLLIDEVDAFLATHEDARGILNAGFNREGAFVIRCVGDDHQPAAFNVWGAKVLCGIGKLANTLEDRSLPLRLRRRLPGEEVENLRHADPGQWDQLCSRLAGFALDNAEAIQRSRPAPIPTLNDRANDVWEPLLAIADLAGEHWPTLARQAAARLHPSQDESLSIGVELLADIQAVFEAKHTDKVFSAALLDALVADEEAPWATWNRGKPMSPRQLAAKLTEFGIRSNTIRQGSKTLKGYVLDQFGDAFTRYLSPSTAPTSVTASHPSHSAGCSDFPGVTPPTAVTDKNMLYATAGVECDVVTDSSSSLHGDEKAQPQWDDADVEVF